MKFTKLTALMVTLSELSVATTWGLVAGAASNVGPAAAVSALLFGIGMLCAFALFTTWMWGRTDWSQDGWALTNKARPTETPEPLREFDHD